VLVKSSRRAGTAVDARDLLQHLLHGEGNEAVMEVSGPGFLASLLDDARTYARGPDALWHMSISPALPLSAAQWDRVRDVIRDAYGLSADLPIACVEHRKPHRAAVRHNHPDRAAHRHYAFPTTDPITGRKINPYRHYMLNERIARQLEHEFEHPFVKGRHNVSVARFAGANGMQELAVAMHEAGLLDGAPPRQRVSDGERRVGQRRGRDPFASADVSATILASVKPSAPSPGLAYLRGMRDGGFIVARGERGLVLVPADGGRVVGAARKAGVTEAALRALVADEIDRLPTIAKGADVKTWLASHAAAYDIDTSSPEDVVTEEPGNGETNPLASAGPEGHRDGHGAPRNPSRGRQQGNVTGDVRHDPRGDGGGQSTAVEGVAGASGGRIPPAANSGSADGRGGIPDPDRAPVDRARIENAQAERILRRLNTGKLEALTALLHGVALVGPVRREIVLCTSTGASSASTRRRRWVAATMRGAYDMSWVPESIAANVKHVYVNHAHAAVVLTLWSGTRLVDRHDRIYVVGEVDDVAVEELVEAVRRRGWDAVELHGDETFRRAAARALALVEPSIAVAGNPLDPVELDELADLVARRRPRAPSPLALSPSADGATVPAYDRVPGGSLHGLG
jgi:hypothetical protein